MTFFVLNDQKILGSKGSFYVYMDSFLPFFDNLIMDISYLH